MSSIWLQYVGGALATVRLSNGELEHVLDCSSHVLLSFRSKVDNRLGPCIEVAVDSEAGIVLRDALNKLFPPGEAHGKRPDSD